MPIRPRATVAALAAILSVQVLFQNAFLVFAICLAAAATVCRFNRKAAILPAVTCLLAAVSLVPYIPILRRVSEWVVIEKRDITFGAIFDAFAQTITSQGRIMPFVWGALPPVLIGLGIVQISRQKSTEHNHAPSPLTSYTLAASLIGAVLFVTFFDLMNVYPFPRYCLPLVALWAVCLDALATRVLAGGLLRTAVAAAVVVATLGPVWPAVQIRQTNMDLAAREVSARATQDDFILVTPWYLGASFSRYYSGKARVSTIPPLDDLRIHRYGLLKSSLAAPNPIQPLLQMLTATLRTGHRVWVIGGLQDVSLQESIPHLEPAPANGWASAPYLTNWAKRVRRCLDYGGVSKGRYIVCPDCAVNPYETVLIEVIER